jgi:hypothetical protein
MLHYRLAQYPRRDVDNDRSSLTFPRSVEIIRHEIEKVDVILHGNGIEPFEISKIGWPGVVSWVPLFILTVEMISM